MNPFTRTNYIQEMIDGEPTVVEITECLDPFVDILVRRSMPPNLPIIDVEEVVDKPVLGVIMNETKGNIEE